MHHSDKGCQYTSLDFTNRLRDLGLVPSYGSTGDCYDNAAMETFWATLKRELSWICGPLIYMNRARLRSVLFVYIEIFYNRERAQAGLGHLTPFDYEPLSWWPDFHKPVSTDAGQLHRQFRVDGVRDASLAPTAVALSAVRNSHDGSLLVDLTSRNATCNGKDLKLISKECDVLVELMSHDYQALSYDQLFECCADFPRGLSREDRKKRVFYIVLRLRHKIWWARPDLESAERGPIETVRGFGYRYCSENL